MSDFTTNTDTQQIVIFQPDSEHPVSLRFDANKREIWMTQKQIAELFDLDISGVSRHIQNFKRQRGLGANQAIAQYAITTTGGVKSVEHYNHKVITFVGYNAKATERTLEFQDWVEDLIDKAIQPARGLNPLQILQQMVETFAHQQAQIASINEHVIEHDTRLESLEAHVQPEMEYFTVIGYFRKRGLTAPSHNQAISIGQHAAKLSKERGYATGKTSDPRYGEVNTYHVSILDEATGKA